MTSAVTDRASSPENPSTRSPRRSRPTLVAAVVVGIVIALLVFLLATRDKAGDRIASADLIGEQAPGISGGVVLGRPFDIGASDRWTVVNFFATWCGPCIREHPELRAFAQEHDDIGDARVVSVVYDEQPAAVADFFRENGGDWTVLDSDQGRTALDWGVAKVPESYVVAPTGIIVERFVGGVTRDSLNAVIAAYAQPAPPPDGPQGSPGATGGGG